MGLTVGIYNTQLHSSVSNWTCWELWSHDINSLLIVQEGHWDRSSTLKKSFTFYLTRYVSCISYLLWKIVSRTLLLQLEMFFFLRLFGGKLTALVYVPATVLWLNSNFLLCFCLVDSFIRALSGEESGQSALMPTKTRIKSFWYFGQLPISVVFILYLLASL